MKSYRKRFVLFNMAFIGVVLLLGFLALGIYLYTAQVNELKNTMREVLSPLSRPNENFRPIFDDDSVISDNEKPNTIPEIQLPDGEEKPVFDGRNEEMRENERNHRIIPLFTDPATGQTTAIGELGFSEEDLSEILTAIRNSESEFGLLSARKLYYYRTVSVEGEKIAIAESSYITRQIVTVSLLFAAIYLVIMVFLLFLSIRLSAYAVKPAEDAAKMERQFVDDVSHDLKTPITVVLANTSILKSAPDAAVREQMQWIDSTEESAKKMLKMVNEMLTLSASENGKRPVTGKTDLTEAVEKAVLQQESVAFEKSVTIESVIDGGVFGEATPEIAERIAMTLLENALKYEPEGGTVSVSLSTQKKKPVLTVRNAGSTISPEDLPHVFERFYRSDKARNTEGFGLGLPILKAVAESVNAEVSVESSQELGTEFSVRFSAAS